MFLGQCNLQALETYLQVKVQPDSTRFCTHKYHPLESAMAKTREILARAMWMVLEEVPERSPRWGATWSALG